MLWLCYTEPRREQDVQDQCKALGVEAWYANRAIFKRRGKRREADLVYEIDFPRVLFVDMDDAQLARIQRKVRYLSPTMQPLGKMDTRDVRRYQSALTIANAEAERLEAATEGRKALISAFRAGQSLEVTEGALAGIVGPFVKLVQRSHDIFPMAQIEGPWGKTLVDPLHLKVGD